MAKAAGACACLQSAAVQGRHDQEASLFEPCRMSLETTERMPAMGSPRLGQLCELPVLSSWRVTGFPMQWLYFEADGHLDVVRLLGDRQDIVAILSADE